ncbi:DUF6045 family protein [Oscillospiraceae bacterium OttesenSCG-928-G22]|nr:DUF6045 family protein [Oscillospiraceae bacterium OttesenSCG-928-G22]
MDSVWQSVMDYFYGEIVKFLSDFFTQINGMGIEVIELPWIQALITFFQYFGWTLFLAGMAVAVFDCAIEAQNGKPAVRDLALNTIKGFLAVSLFTIVPVELFKFCIGLQGDLGRALATVFQLDALQNIGSIAENALATSLVLFATINPSSAGTMSIFGLLFAIALGYCVIKCFFANIKRGGILLINLAVGSVARLPAAKRWYGNLSVTRSFATPISVLLAKCSKKTR